MRVFLADDQELLAEALSAKLSGNGLLVTGRSTTTDPHLAEKADRAHPHVITVDIEAAGSAAGRLLGCLAAAVPPARIVVLTGSRDPAQVVVATRCGAVAWIGKDSSTEHLIAVLHGVCAGEAHFPPDLLGSVLPQLRADGLRAHNSGSPLDLLTTREHDVLLGMVEGKRSPQIAAELFLSVNTVRTHTHNLFNKLKVHSRLEAASIARAAGLLPRFADAPAGGLARQA
ncbi:LuxR C-terminal-related transcriptional regulator [Amycolatopsis magusensis]|uniref:LuxR C-terminal-related transcriptional regulator n=1 Tax=Amycolatopsis magusensis TaxID=882444 RepID=UPI00378734F3